jgi:hypothetical protein
MFFVSRALTSLGGFPLCAIFSLQNKEIIDEYTTKKGKIGAGFRPLFSRKKEVSTFPQTFLQNTSCKKNTIWYK